MNRRDFCKGSKVALLAFELYEMKRKRKDAHDGLIVLNDVMLLPPISSPFTS
jgi:hypothetical protein